VVNTMRRNTDASVADAAKTFRVILGGLVTMQHKRLIEDHPRGSIHGMRIPTLRVHVSLRAGDKEAARLMQPLQAEVRARGVIRDHSEAAFRLSIQ
jgi:hypothetical protein